MLLPVAKSALGLTDIQLSRIHQLRRKILFQPQFYGTRGPTRSIQRTVARHAHHKHEPDFHDKYGNIILLSGAVCCASIWAYVATQIGIVWNFSPVGRVTPKEWREQ